jgi:UDP-glucuronate decarboxylase
MVYKILVTGGAGFIGSRLASRLSFLSDSKVTVVDNLSTGKMENLHPTIEFIKCDVNNYSEIAEIMLSRKFDYVFHYAAMVGVQRTQNNPIGVLRDIEGFKNILSLCKSTGVQHVYFSSSSEVYGESIEYPQNEHTTPLNSRLPYAIVKNVGEAFLKSYHKEHGLPYTIFRFFNTYGSRQSPDFVISKFIQAAIDNKPITIYGDGSQTRTFCSVGDNVDTCVKIFRDGLVKNDVINIGGDSEISVLDLAKLVIEITGSNSEILFVPKLKEGDMSRRVPDNTKMKQILGRELVSLKAGLSYVIENMRQKDT